MTDKFIQNEQEHEREKESGLTRAEIEKDKLDKANFDEAFSSDNPQSFFYDNPADWE